MKLKIKHKIFLVVFSIILVFILNGIVCIISFNKSLNVDESISTNYNPLLNKLKEFHVIINNANELTQNWVYIADAEQKTKLVSLQDSLYPALKNEITALIPDTSSLQVLKTHILDFDKIIDSQKEIMSSLVDYTDYDNDVKIDHCILLIDETINPGTKKLEDEINEAEITTKAIINGLIIKKHKLFSLLNWLLIFSIIFSVVLGLISSLVLNKSIVNPIAQLKTYIEKLTQGDLTSNLDLITKDEIMEIVHSLNAFTLKLRSTIDGFKNSAYNIKMSGNEFQIHSEHVSKGSEYQSNSAENISVSIEEMSSNIQQTSVNSQQMLVISKDISNNMKRTNQEVAETEKAILAIDKKVSVVSQIASRTNILALNASVEAARAGNSGRGFSVVAAEVRKLAEQSQIAADEIIKLTKQCVELINHTSSEFSQFTGQIGSAIQLIEEVACASNEQSGGIMQIEKAIHELTKVVKQNEEISRKTVSQSNNLILESEQLNNHISFFTTSGKN